MQKEPVKPSLSTSPEVRNSALGRLRSHLKGGHVYRREDLLGDSNAVDRHLKQVVDAGDNLQQVSGRSRDLVFF